MKLRRGSALFVAIPFLAVAVGAQESISKLPEISKQTRMDLIRAFNAELVYVRTAFPMGKKGLRIKNGVVSPQGDELQQLVAMWGPAAKAGDQARITTILIKDKLIHFEINGGPVKKKRWYERITVGGMGGEVPISPNDPNANPRGSFVDLEFDRYVPELNPRQLKDLLHPVFDFNAKSAAEAYLDTVPPKVKDAIKNHRVLVGMNREMVTYAKGRPPKKVREKDAAGENEYEEWIYGNPPQDVDFVRLLGDEVVRVETMKVDGQKTVRTEKEVDLATPPSVAREEAPAEKPAGAPSLRRPGEELPEPGPPKTMPTGGRAPMPPTQPPPPPNNDPGGQPIPQILPTLAS